ncbi:MAG: fructosamine kinase family protein [Bacteroidota bacterium]
MLPAAIKNSLLHEAGLSIKEVHSLTGGCIHQAAHLKTSQGGFFIKWNSLQQAHNLAVEAKGLQLLRSTQTFRIPEVILQKNTEQHCFLLLTYIQPGRLDNNYWTYFGRTLAKLHLHSSPNFGLGYDNYIGALPQDNSQSSDWISFFRERRLQPMVEMARKKGLMPSTVSGKFDNLYQNLSSLLPEESPACIHGDLWGGNILCGAEGLPVLIDPSVHYAHREIELAFMTMFDRIPAQFYEAYEEVFPLKKGYKERFRLYNLYPLLVHLNLFGAGYLNSIQISLKHYV